MSSIDAINIKFFDKNNFNRKYKTIMAATNWSKSINDLKERHGTKIWSDGHQMSVEAEYEGKVIRKYTWKADPHATFRQALKEPRNYHEILGPTRPRKMYFDIDIEASKVGPGVNLVKMGMDIVCNIILGCETICKERGVGFDVQEDVALYPTSGVDRKFSMHIVFPQLIVNGYLEAKQTALDIVEVTKTKDIMRNALVNNFIDMSIYNKQSALRMFMSSKLGSDRVKSLMTRFKYFDVDVNHDVIYDQESVDVDSTSEAALGKKFWASLLGYVSSSGRQRNIPVALAPKKDYPVVTFEGVPEGAVVAAIEAKLKRSDFEYEPDRIDDNGLMIFKRREGITGEVMCEICKRTHGRVCPFVVVKESRQHKGLKLGYLRCFQAHGAKAQIPLGALNPKSKAQKMVFEGYYTGLDGKYPQYTPYESDRIFGDFIEEFDGFLILRYQGIFVTSEPSQEIQEIIDQKPFLGNYTGVDKILWEMSRVMRIVNDGGRNPKLFMKTGGNPFNCEELTRFNYAGKKCRLVDISKSECEEMLVPFPKFLEIFGKPITSRSIVVEPYPNDPNNILRLREKMDPRNFNVFPGFNAMIVPLDNEKEKLAEEFLDFLFTCTASGDEKVYRHILMFFYAPLVMYRRPEVIFTINGDEGAGKGILFTIFGDFMAGKHLYHCYGSLEELATGFNFEMKGKLMIYIEEVPNTVSYSSPIIKKLNGLCTAEIKAIHGKGKDVVREEINRIAIAMSANDERCITNLTKKDRRYLLVEVSGKRAGDLEFWSVFRSKFRNQEFANILYSYMHTEKFSDTILKKHRFESYLRPPETDLRERIIDNSKSLSQEYFDEIMAKTWLLPDDAIVIPKSKVPFLITSIIWEDFDRFMTSRKVKEVYKTARRSFVNELGKWLGTKTRNLDRGKLGRTPGFDVPTEIYDKLMEVVKEDDLDYESD